MGQNEFLINKRYLVQPSLNLVKDLSLEKETKVESRLMKLLCLLAENEGKLVSREYLVKEIWNDYGGGDEGLTQAVSFLRKLLNDDQKQLIETIPKSGYMLQFEIKQATAPDAVNPSIRKIDKRIWYAMIIVSMTLIFIFYILKKEYNRRHLAPKATPNRDTTPHRAPKANP